MSPRRSRAALTASPVLVGAVTVLVTIVAVFLSYNANTGLPVRPHLRPEGQPAQRVAAGRGLRRAHRRRARGPGREDRRRSGATDGTAYAQITLKLDKEIEPLPADSTVLVRPRSALGLKYLQVAPGSGQAGFKAGATIPIRQATARGRGDRRLLQHVRRQGARWARATRSTAIGTGFAGRGRDLNTAIDELRPLLDDLEPVATNLAGPQTRLDRFFKALADTATEVAPVAEEQASLFVNLDTTFTALASIARPFLQESISEGPPSEEVAIREFPRAASLPAQQRRVLPRAAARRGHAAALGADPGRRLPGGHRDPAQTPPMNERARGRLRHAGGLLRGPARARRRDQLTRLVLVAAADAGLPHARSRPSATTPRCFFRNAASLLSDGDANGQLAALHDHPDDAAPRSRPIPTSRSTTGRPSRPNGPGPANHLHSNPYPNTASPGQTQGVRGGQRALLERHDHRQHARQPGHERPARPRATTGGDEARRHEDTGSAPSRRA